MPDCETAGDVNEANCENEGVWLETLPLALLSCVTEDSKAGPGMSVICAVSQERL